jgi:hypothetical protein
MQSLHKVVLKLGLVLLLAAVMVEPVAASEWPEIKSPPDSVVSWVGNDMSQNGIPLKIKAFSSSLSVEDVINFYRSEWDDGTNKKPVTNTLADWHIIGRQIDEYYVTVQAKPGVNTNSEGFLSVSKLPAKLQRENTVDFPMLAQSRVISNTESSDPGTSGKTIIIENGFSTQSNVSFYESRLGEQGWKMTRDDLRQMNGKLAKYMYFRLRNKSCHLVISQDNAGNSVITANIVETN